MPTLGKAGPGTLPRGEMNGMTGSRYMWAEDVAELTGTSTKYIRKRLHETLRDARAGVALTASHLPLPDAPTDDADLSAGYARRKVSNGTHDVTIVSPRWRRKTIVTWMAGRPGRGRAGIPRKPAAV